MRNVVKRVCALALVVCMVLSLAGCGKSEGGAVEKYGSDTLKIFLPGEYMGEELIPNFEKQFGVKVIVELFDSNEMMYTKLSAGESYDVLIPSDYMIERLIKENSLQKLDMSKIPNTKDLYEELKGMEYDPNDEYTVPYFWGTVGIVYNHNNVSEEDLLAKNWDIFKDERYKGKVYMYDSERDGFMIAQKQLGYSCNDDNEDAIMACYDWLVDFNKTMEPIYVTDEVIDFMMNGYKDLAIVYSGDAVTILAENEDMSYYVPKCGSNVWCDAMVIPKNAENPKLAHEFINYVLSYDASLDNTLTVGYASTNKNVYAEMTAEGGEYEGNMAYLSTGNTNLETYRDNEVLRKKISELWIKVKAAK